MYYENNYCEIVFWLFIVAFLFCVFQYGVGDSAPFHNTWQAWVMGIAFVVSLLILFQDILFLKSWKNV